jgi:hypothetical protein
MFSVTFIFIFLASTILFACKQTDKKTNGIRVSLRDRKWAEAEFKHEDTKTMAGQYKQLKITQYVNRN